MSNKDQILRIQERDNCSYEEAEQRAIDESADMGDMLYDRQRDEALIGAETEG